MMAARTEELIRQAETDAARLTDEIAALEAESREAAFEAVVRGNPKARQRVMRAEDTLAAKHRLLAATRAGIEHGKVVLGRESAADAARKRETLERQRETLDAERDGLYAAVEECVAHLVDVVGRAIALDGTLRNVESQLGVPQGRRAQDVISGFVATNLSRRAGIDLTHTHEAFLAQISTRRSDTSKEPPGSGR